MSKLNLNKRNLDTIFILDVASRGVGIVCLIIFFIVVGVQIGHRW